MENNKMKVNNNNELPHGIKTPKSVKEFRENLGKYFWTGGGQGKQLYIQLPNGTSEFIDIEKFSSFEDIYEITKTGFSYGGGSPCICPKIDMIKEIDDYMNETGQVWSVDGYFLNEENYDYVDDQFSQENPKWYSLDNQIGREFFRITLGDYCGYGKLNIKEVV
jgi:hypothetical protein